jgi:hypothetical protein
MQSLASGQLNSFHILSMGRVARTPSIETGLGALLAVFACRAFGFPLNHQGRLYNGVNSFDRVDLVGRVARTINPKTTSGAQPSVFEGGAFDFSDFPTRNPQTFQLITNPFER